VKHRKILVLLEIMHSCAPVRSKYYKGKKVNLNQQLKGSCSEYGRSLIFHIEIQRAGQNIMEKRDKFNIANENK
jgi:hypothetical protein